MKTPKKTRDAESSRRAILEVAFKEIFARGFQGVSVDDIVRKTEMTKGAFYHHFPTKLDLGYALVEDVIQPMILERWVNPLDSEEDPLHGILERMHTLIGKASAAELKLGCPLNNLVQEMSSVDAGFKKRLQAALKVWIDGIERQVKRAQTNGVLKPEVVPRQVAYFVVMAHEGFYGMLKGINDPKAFEALYVSLQQYFETIRASDDHSIPYDDRKLRKSPR